MKKLKCFSESSGKSVDENGVSWILLFAAVSFNSYCGRIKGVFIQEIKCDFAGPKKRWP